MGTEALEGDAVMTFEPGARVIVFYGWLLLSLLLPQAAIGENLQVENPQDENQQTLDQRADVIIVVGAAGEESFGESFADWAQRWREVADQAGAAVTMIGLESIENDENDQQFSTDHERLQGTIAELQPDGEAAVWIVMMGHGTSSQNIAKFNLRGPDVSAEELARWVKPIDRPLVVVNASSSSGPFINALSGPNRVIVTATRSGSEQNYSRFGDYLSQAIGQASSDIDHDGEISILEAFLAASAAVRGFYQSSGRIATEHALIDDNADSLGTPATAFRGTRVVAKPAKPGQLADGALARRLALSPPAARLPLTEQEQIERDEIEAQLARLRLQHADVTDADYQAAALPLLLRLARIYQAAQARAESPEPLQSQ
jgi:hypothetical protein